MTTLTTSLKKGGIVLLDPLNGSLQRIIVFQYNPDTLTRTLKIEEVEDSKNGRARALKLKGPPVETFKVDVEIDATSKPDFLDRSSEVGQEGHLPRAVCPGDYSLSQSRRACRRRNPKPTRAR